MAGSAKEKVYNVNVGVLGHVDSGKTSLGKPLIIPLKSRNFCYSRISISVTAFKLEKANTQEVFCAF
jgi:translation elongation factor EF-Tu-like GTPase